MANATRLIVSICDDQPFPAKTFYVKFPKDLDISFEDAEKEIAEFFLNIAMKYQVCEKH